MCSAKKEVWDMKQEGEELQGCLGSLGVRQESLTPYSDATQVRHIPSFLLLLLPHQDAEAADLPREETNEPIHGLEPASATEDHRPVPR